MIFRCEHCGREFSYRASLRNHIKTHDNTIDKILHEISKESIQPEQLRDIERNDEEKDQESEEMIIITEEETQLENMNDMSYDYENQLGEELVNVYEEDVFERELAGVYEEELINTDDDDDQVCFILLRSYKIC